MDHVSKTEKNPCLKTLGISLGISLTIFCVGSFVSELLQQRVHRTVLCERKADDAMSQLLAPAFKATPQS